MWALWRVTVGAERIAEGTMAIETLCNCLHHKTTQVDYSLAPTAQWPLRARISRGQIPGYGLGAGGRDRPVQRPQLQPSAREKHLRAKKGLLRRSVTPKFPHPHPELQGYLNLALAAQFEMDKQPEVREVRLGGSQHNLGHTRLSGAPLTPQLEK